jgi:hypothetical protein
MPCLGTTETIQRVGLLDLTSITERTIPVTRNPFNITVAFWPRYWAKRQRRASIRSVISKVCMHHQWSAVRETIPRRSAGYRATVNNDSEQPQSIGRFASRSGLRFDDGMPRDPFIREKFTRELSAARKLARDYFQRFPKERYQTEVESRRQSQNYEFTMKRLRDPIETGGIDA